MHVSECVVLRGYCRYHTALLPFGPSELVQLGSIMSDSECLATDVVDAAAELGFDKIVISHIARIVPSLIPTVESVCSCHSTLCGSIRYAKLDSIVQSESLIRSS